MLKIDLLGLKKSIYNFLITKDDHKIVATHTHTHTHTHIYIYIYLISSRRCGIHLIYKIKKSAWYAWSRIAHELDFIGLEICF
jgi:hypothetical protein